MDTFLDANARSLFVLCYAMLVLPHLGIPLALNLVLEVIVLVCQALPLGPFFFSVAWDVAILLDTTATHGDGVDGIVFASGKS